MKSHFVEIPQQIPIIGMIILLSRFGHMLNFAMPLKVNTQRLTILKITFSLKENK